MPRTSCRVRAGSCSQRLFEHFRELGEHVRELEHQIKVWHRESEASRRLEAIPGIGGLTASALVASVGRCQDVQERPTARCMVRA